MRWNVNMILELLKDLMSANQSGKITAGKFFNMWNSEQAMFFQDIVGRWQARGNGKSGRNTGLMLNEISLSELAWFTINHDLSVSGGFADKPEDFEYFIDLRVGAIYKVQLIRPDQRPAVAQSVIDPPNVLANKVYAMEFEDYYEFLPNSITAAQLDYIASPTGIKWGFSFDSEGRQIYNPGSSIQPKWSNVTIIEITKRTLTNFGVSWKDADFTNAGRIAQTTGY